MFKNPFIPIAIIAVGIIIFYNFFSGESTKSGKENAETNNNTSTKENIVKTRQEKDKFFKTNEKSPILEKDNFKNLHYFDYAPTYKVEAHIHPEKAKDTLYITSSKGEKEPYLKYAKAHFTLQGKECNVLILQKIGMPNIPFLLAFKDATSGKTTYGGGRYIDIPASALKNKENINIDFNQAYFPYCAYNPNYICPIPPKENHLDISIEAGEKN